VELLGKMSDLDRKAHGMWYEQIASEGETADESSASEIVEVRANESASGST
jgi:hypothetical protein